MSEVSISARLPVITSTVSKQHLLRKNDDTCVARIEKVSRMRQTNNYEKTWEGYWATFKDVSDHPIWDVDAEKAGAIDLPRFQHLMDPTLPLVDFGCGNGSQTRFLAQHFQQVLGVDVAPAAIELAATLGKPANVEYRVLDALREDDAKTLHAELGDVNIYMRTVLHQLSARDQPACAATLTSLLGRNGTLYLIELAAEAKAYLTQLKDQQGEPPPSLKKVLEHGIVPGGVDRDRILALFGADHFAVLTEGRGVINTIHTFPNGENAQVPAYYMVLRARC